MSSKARKPRLIRTPFGYETPDGWKIEKDCDTGWWVIYNPETGRGFDSTPDLRTLRETYGRAAPKAMADLARNNPAAPMDEEAAR